MKKVYKQNEHGVGAGVVEYLNDIEDEIKTVQKQIDKSMRKLMMLQYALDLGRQELINSRD